MARAPNQRQVTIVVDVAACIRWLLFGSAAVLAVILISRHPEQAKPIVSTVTSIGAKAVNQIT